MPKRITFTVTTRAHKLHDCARCHRHLHAGERATSIVRPGLAVMTHAGRWCPRLPAVDRHPFLR